MSDETSLDDFIDQKTKQQIQKQESVFGECPKEWEVSNLDNSRLFESTSSGLEEFSGTKIYIPTAGVEIGQIVDNDGYISYDDRPSRANLELSAGDVIFAKMKDSIKVLKASKQLAEEYVFSTGFIRISSDKNVNSEYLKQVLLSSEFNQRKDSLAIGSTQPAIRLSDLSALDIPIPPIQEQEKIATVLHTVDQAIQKTEEIIKQTKKVKKGVAQDIIHTGIKQSQTKSAWMGEIPSHWDVKEFSELVDFSQNGIYKESDEYGGSYPIIKMGDIFGGVMLDKQINERVHLDNDENKKYGVEKGDLIFARHAQAGWGAGDCTYVPDLDKTAVVESNMVQVRLTGDTEPLFYAQYFNNEIGVKSIKRITTTGNIKSISKSDLMKLKVPTPPKDEQKEIAEVLSDFDRKVEHLESEIKHLRDIKEGLMQDLLSGKVRTDMVNIDIAEEVIKYG